MNELTVIYGAVLAEHVMASNANTSGHGVLEPIGMAQKRKKLMLRITPDMARRPCMIGPGSGCRVSVRYD